MQKSANMITDDAVKMISGIENIEVFLEENDEWQFHDSEISYVHWNNKERQLDVCVKPTYCVGVEYDHKILEPELVLHFTKVRDYKLDYNEGGYVDEISIKECNGFLDTWFDCYMLHVTSRGLTVDKPRFVPRKEK